jgi:hypothetical protein
MLMKKRVATTKVRPFILACLTTIAAGPQVSIATVGTGPAINLFTPMSIESLSATSKSAKALESSLESLIEKLETQSSLYEAANCSVSNDSGCQKLLRGMKETYRSLLVEMQDHIPEIRESIEVTRDSLANQMQMELGRKMTPGDLQRLLAGRNGASDPFQSQRSSTKGGRLSGLFEGYYKLVKRNGAAADSGAVLASELYLDSMYSAKYLDLIEAEIDSQQTELLLELEWVDLTAQMDGTVGSVKRLLWGDVGDREELLNIGLEPSAETKAMFSDLYVN